jgi:hypothetical protein
MGGRIDLEQCREGLPRAVVLAGVVVRAAQRLEDRALAGFEPGGPLQHDRRLRVVAPLQEVVAALEQLVGGLAVRGLVFHAVMVA